MGEANQQEQEADRDFGYAVLQETERNLLRRVVWETMKNCRTGVATPVVRRKTLTEPDVQHVSHRLSTFPFVIIFPALTRNTVIKGTQPLKTKNCILNF